MSPANRTVRLPSAALVVLSIVVHFTSAHPYALPQPTKTLDYRELNVLPWPLAATAAPGNFDDLLNRRALNTVCGYIGGDPALPATCSAGSHCVIEVEQGAVGCCPDSGACTQGVYTGCVDLNSGAQSEVNPYVFTCQGSNVCYKNSFEGGYTQYGCGTSSGLATTVVGTASGKSTIHLTSISVSATQTAESSESTKKSTSSRTRSSETATETATETSTTETSTTKTKSNTKTSSTESSTQSASETSSASESTETDGASSTNSGDASSSSTSAASAPDTDGDNNGSRNTGAIIGGAISGVAALVALIFLGVWLWKRKKGNNGGNQKAQPGSEGNGNIQPLLPMQEGYENRPPPPIPVARGTMTPLTELDEEYRAEPYQPNYPYGYGPGSSAGGIMAVGNGSHQMDQDEVPLTRHSREIDDYPQGYDSGLVQIPEEQSRPPTAPVSNPDSPTVPYPGPRGGGGGPLWQQNRGPSWV